MHLLRLQLQLLRDLHRATAQAERPGVQLALHSVAVDDAVRSDEAPFFDVLWLRVKPQLRHVEGEVEDAVRSRQEVHAQQKVFAVRLYEEAEFLRDDDVDAGSLVVAEVDDDAAIETRVFAGLDGVPEAPLVHHLGVDNGKGAPCVSNEEVAEFVVDDEFDERTITPVKPLEELAVRCHLPERHGGPTGSDMGRRGGAGVTCFQ